MNILCSSDIVHSYYMTSARGHCFEKISLFISRDLFSRDLFSFLCVYFYVTLKIFWLFYFDQDNFSKKTYLVRSSLVILYPCLQTISCFAQEPEYTTPVCLSWNLNGLAAHDFVRVPLSEALIIAHNFVIVQLPETFLDSTTPYNDENININGHT